MSDVQLWPGVDLHVVSGKGGTGKTTVAASLALALAHGGKRTLLMEVEGRQGIAQLFDTAPLPYEERMIAVAPEGGEVWAMAVDPQEALLDYLEQFYNLRRAGAALKKMGAVDFVTTIAPGLRDVLLTGKAIEVVRRKPDDKKNHYDAVVMDAPPTGRITKFLNVNSEMSGLAKVGPIRNHADLVMGVIASPRTAVHLVTLLEEMPVQETVDGITELKAAGLPVGAVFVNMTRPSVLTDDQRAAAIDGTLPLNQIGADLVTSGVIEEPLAAGLLAGQLAHEARDYAMRIALEGRELRRIEELSLRHLTLPLLPSGVDLGGLYELAACLRAEGVR